MSSNLITQPYGIILDPTGGGGRAKPVANGRYHVGIIDLDPVANPRTDLVYKDESGTERPLTSPLTLNNSGAFVVSESDGTLIQPYMKQGVGHSVLITDKRGTHVYSDNHVGDPGNLTDKITELTDIVYKASGGNSAVDNMVLGIPITAKIGDKCTTKGTTWERVSDAGSLSDFKPLTDIYIEAFGATPWVTPLDIPTNAATNTAAIQQAINYCASNKINSLHSSSGHFYYDRLWFVYDATNNPDYPSSPLAGWNFKFIGRGKLSVSALSNLDTELENSAATVFESINNTDISINARYADQTRTQNGNKFEGMSFISNSTNWIFDSSAITENELFKQVSFYQKNRTGNGVRCEDIWFTDWSGLSITLPDYQTGDTGTALQMRNRLFSGGGLWKLSQIDIRGGVEQFEIGYFTDTGDDIKLLDSIDMDTVQTRNGFNGLKIGGKVRSIEISCYHTEGNKNLGAWIKAEAKNVKFNGGYFDCANCGTASVLIGSNDTGSGPNLNTETWENVEFNKTQFQSTNIVGLKVFNGLIGKGLTLKDVNFEVGSGSGTSAVDLNNFRNGVYFENVTYDSSFSNQVINRPVPSFYVDDGTFKIYKSVTQKFEKSGVSSKTISGQIFLSALDSEYLYVSPSAGNERIVMYDPTTENAEGRKHIVKNASSTAVINFRNNANDTTLFTLQPGEVVTVINDGSGFLFF